MNTNPHPDALRSRWTLEGRIPLSGVADGAVWHRARSIATGEDVVLFVVRGEAALEAADAVRRAYLIEDPHLLPVQDIVVLDDPRETDQEQSARASTATGTADGPVTVVEYPLPSAPPLAALLAEGALHPETARAIIGEAATGLETARRRGVRHQLLDSNRVFVDTRSGEVTLLGIGVEAASHPGFDRSREIASFQDTAALVALLYRALTGRSPRHDATGTVPRPSTVMDTPIPADLDLLCDLVLNESADEIPETTRELIEALQPWQSIPVTLEAYSRTPGEAPAAAAVTAPAREDAAPDHADDELESTALMTVVPGGDEEAAPTSEQSAGTASDARAEAEVGTERDPEAAQLLDEDTVARSSSSGSGLVIVAGAAALAGSDPAERKAQDGHGPSAATTVPASSREPYADDASDPSSPSAPSTTSAPTDASKASNASNASTVPVAGDGSAGQEQDSPESGRSAEDAQNAAAAKALVTDLHLDQKRGTSPFPGHLEIMAPPQPAPTVTPAAADDHHLGETSDRTGALGAAGAAGALGTARAVGAAGIATSREKPSSRDGIPSRTSGTHWPLATGEEHTASLAPTAAAPDAPTQAARIPAPTPDSAAAATPDHSAPTPSGPVVHGSTSTGTGPVAVGGRTDPVAPVRRDGPIVVHGRDRSLLEDPPEESTVPFARSSLLRDVVGVAVANDAPETYTMGPRDEEKRSLQSQWIIIGGALAVMIALVIALTTITSDIRDILADPLATATPVATSAPAEEEETDEAPVEPTAEETEEALPAPELAGVELFALPSDQEPDHTDQQDRLTDGDTSTFWSTQHYASPDFGGLKEGVGMRLTFAEKSTFTAVTLSTARNNGGTVELRTVNEDGGPGEVLASGDFVADGEVLLEAPEKLETDKVMLWITELPSDSNENGRFRARIAEIQVR